MPSAETVVLATLAAAVAGAMLREALCSWSWRRSIGRLDRGEWTRLVRGLRDR